MNINAQGHVVNSNGLTTQPTRSQFWCGDNNFRIGFDFLVLDDGKVALHSFYGNVDDQVAEDFLYEVVESNIALASAVEMVNIALSFLLEEGAVGVESNLDTFIDALKSRA